MKLRTWQMALLGAATVALVYSVSKLYAKKSNLLTNDPSAPSSTPDVIKMITDRQWTVVKDGVVGSVIDPKYVAMVTLSTTKPGMLEINNAYGKLLDSNTIEWSYKIDPLKKVLWISK